MSNNYETIQRVWNELSDIDEVNSVERLEIAHALCKNNNILFSDLVLYEKFHSDNGTNPYTENK